MGLFGFLRKKKAELTEEQLRWNKMWELWTEEKVESPYSELMKYSADVNNGGHAYYFECPELENDIEKDMSALEQILPPNLYDNLKKAYQAYLTSKEKEHDEESEAILAQCDNIFYENEEEINRILKEYASKIDPSFPFCEQKNTVIVTCAHVIKNGSEILYVSHDEDDGMWQFLCGKAHAEKDAMVVSLNEIFALDNTVGEIANMPCGCFAERKSKASKWRIRKN